VAWELARAFGRAGIPNRVITSAVGAPVGQRTTVHRIARFLSHIPIRGPLGRLGRAVVIPLFTVAATLVLRRHPDDRLVISHGDCLRGDALVVHAVNAEYLALKRGAGSWQWLLNPIHLWVSLRDRWMIGGLRYRMFIAVSGRTAKELRKHYGIPPARIRVIPNGIDVERFRRDPVAGRALRQELRIPAEAKLLLFAGNEFLRKGLAHVIGALRLLGACLFSPVMR
jgi:glycosyltransferase involved in cell wall biosynthesis